MLSAFGLPTASRSPANSRDSASSASSEVTGRASFKAVRREGARRARLSVTERKRAVGAGGGRELHLELRLAPPSMWALLSSSSTDSTTRPPPPSRNSCWRLRSWVRGPCPRTTLYPCRRVRRSTRSCVRPQATAKSVAAAPSNGRFASRTRRRNEPLHQQTKRPAESLQGPIGSSGPA